MVIWSSFLDEGQCNYKAVIFLPNPHTLHPIARPRYVMHFAVTNTDIYFTDGTVVMYAISSSRGFRYNGTRMYLFVFMDHIIWFSRAQETA